ncbi:dUTP diphosphatase [Anaerobacillus sp. CMMVII]|nr:dUTP diphosphatase [Anaerobacillus sp. CMMVII]
MNLIKLFKKQKELDDRIVKEHNLEGQYLLSDKILALLVELGELANETRCFKFWSDKPPSAPDIVIEEFVDGIHFL